MDNEKTTNSEASTNIEEPIEGEETALETEAEPRQQDSRHLWIIGGLVVAALALLVLVFEMSRNQLIIRDATGQEVLRFD